ncbi:inhibitor of nuclear factor kappa-B kinase subunit beta-like [Halichondria panicea]|uniref:inhibitor of nuclear factor kappa-B kinase subunit beta-like n=1 Tax=Halichondria panicea TaxID=6063 RepID=UPI00312B8D24
MYVQCVVMAQVGFDAGYSDDEQYHSAGDSPPPSRAQELWTFDRDIGQGGFGIVKLFVHKLTGEKLVLKECRQLNISRESFDRWMQEMEIIKRLDHVNIVKAQSPPEGLYYRPQGNVPCIYMEFCGGGDLRQVLREPDNCCGLPEEDVRQICSDVNSGIRFLHKKKVIHRDLKPENILRKIIHKNKVVYKLTDFGYAKSYDQSSVCTSLVGTMQYVAPEVLKGQHYNSSVDVWSFGVVVFECVTGIRPFLHGEPTMNILWVDCVAKKGPKVIHIHYKDNTDKPVYSDHLPHPHRLSRPLEEELTSWLQTALQFNPELRGAKRLTNEDAPCISHMTTILGTKVMNIVCTATGDVHSYTVTDKTKVSDLKRQFQLESEVKPEEQYLIQPDGTLPLDSDPVTSCISAEEMGVLFMFPIFLMPSFKVMHDSNSSVAKLTSFGDEKISTDARRSVFSHVYHHIRAHHLFFDRLHKAHKAILYQIRIQCTLVREGEQSLLRSYDVVTALLTLLRDMLSSDQPQLQQLPPETIDELTPTWTSMSAQLEDYNARLTQLTNQIADMRREAETYLRLAEEMICTDADNGREFHKYYNSYVARARDILSDIKVSKGRQLSSRGRMQDVLLQAIHQAQFIIETKLNGVSFCQEYVALGHLIQRVESCKENTGQLRSGLDRLLERRNEALWKVARGNSGLVMSSVQRRISRQDTVEESPDGMTDLVQHYSRSQLQREESQDETRNLLVTNRQLLKRLASLPGVATPISPASLSVSSSLPITSELSN